MIVIVKQLPDLKNILQKYYNSGVEQREIPPKISEEYGVSIG